MANVPISNITTTWNNLATTFTGVKLNVTDTASASASLLMDLQVDGSSKFNVDKSGNIIIPANASITEGTGDGIKITSAGADITRNNTVYFRFDYTFLGGMRLGSTLGILWSDNTAASAGTTDLSIYRDDAGTLAQRNAANAQTFRIYNTYTDATNTFERGKIAWESDVLRIGTEKGVTGGLARALELQTDGTTRLTIAATGNLTFVNNTYASGTTGGVAGTWVAASNPRLFIAGASNTTLGLRNGANLFWTSAGLDTPIDVTVTRGGSAGCLQLGNAISSTGWDRLQFGGTTSSFPALKRSSATLIARLADDSANAAFESASLKTDAPTGGTAATWKLGAVASVTPTSPDRTIEVDIGGTIYYLHAKTTND